MYFDDKIYKYDDKEKLQEIADKAEKKKNNKSITYYNIPCAFDIETTSTYNADNEKIAFMYIWQCCINDVTFIGRTWEEFMYFYASIVEIFRTDEKTKLIIYVHNLSYEFQFIRKWVEWSKVFAIKERKPIYAETVDGIIFRCSYLLTNKSLERISENITKTDIKKAVGFLDYNKIRHNNTPLTNTEIEYCVKDVQVLCAYIDEQIEKEKYIFNIPLTQTGYVRRYTRKKCLRKGNKPNYGYKRIIDNLKISNLLEYNMLKSAFCGGFTHSNPFNSNELKKNIIAYDFCSSYPAVMLAYEYPMSKGEFIKIKSKEDFYTKLKCYCCVFTIKLKNLYLKSDNFNECYIQRAKCHSIKKFTECNGRITECEECIITITDLDYYIIDKMYSFDFELSNFIIYQRGKLPKEIIQSILYFYKGKTSLKGVKGMEEEYLNCKEMLNSLYGMCVTDVIRDEYTYNHDEWGIANSTNEEKIEKIEDMNDSFSRFLFYPWGVFVTAYARRALFSGIFECGDDYIYSDTDSIYINNNDKHKEYFKKYNEYIVKKIQDTLYYYSIDIEEMQPMTKEGIKKPIGIWEIDKKCLLFKTLGAKRYIYMKTDGEINITVAGLNKKVCVPYLLEKYEYNIFNEFKNGLTIEKGNTGKLTHTYIDDEIDGNIIDYLGIEGNYKEKSYIHLEETTFEMGLENYLLFLSTLKD